ncbi:TFIIH/NER complex subunit SSL1 KNAG_0B05150 [Huiozyma naganishii CBS 8797]|uniref:General transcription and DNA repair factor IIH n=1 Tax=Huiozyma naganishii (strain ATCC MYA-139 / BCRC 22969 / CBS 8797 / KCTC 17520 / NBRC 10181 / NCYC 3082 / Yp74L-3) TaxID=1071383 RepID=J7RVI8_HUIN7|nr:hypothetical protein KNAG_0B05150 [Kazachstania naganishii CBS 8797]CCK68947.1 hypothetical protein KNAG_0B05150 [Kazachstania naganishii CBS 8797]
MDSGSDSDDARINVSGRRQRREPQGEMPPPETVPDSTDANGYNLRSRNKKHRRLDRDRMKDARNNRRKRKAANKDLLGASGGYAWEDEIKRSWDLVTVDDEGDMTSLVASLVEARKKRAAKRDVTPYQRGIIRTLILTLDCSESMTEKDLRPNRHAMMIQYAIDFVHEFFDENPISQIGIVIMRNGLAHLVSSVSGNPQDHLDALKHMRKQEPKGNPSLQNALELARGLLLPVPSHSTREVLIIFGSLSSTDPGDIHQTIASLVDEKIRVKVIGLSAQVAVCKELCKLTNFGDDSFYKILLDETHFKDLFDEAVTPLPVNKINKGFTLVKMGFPTRVFESVPTFCSCHSKLIYGGYFCPNCHNKVCSLPTVCPCCDLTLILSTHLARSYHHLMPLKTFNEVDAKETFPTENCFACQRRFPILKNHKSDQLLTSSRYRCDDCRQDFCIDCDVFIHEVLHNCPGCESKPTI